MRCRQDVYLLVTSWERAFSTHEQRAPSLLVHVSWRAVASSLLLSSLVCALALLLLDGHCWTHRQLGCRERCLPCSRHRGGLLHQDLTVFPALLRPRGCARKRNRWHGCADDPANEFQRSHLWLYASRLSSYRFAYRLHQCLASCSRFFVELFSQRLPWRLEARRVGQRLVQYIRRSRRRLVLRCTTQALFLSAKRISSACLSP